MTARSVSMERIILSDIKLFMAVHYQMPLYTGFVQLGAGLSVGLAGLAAGFAIGIVGDAGVRGTAQQPRLFVGMVCHIAAFFSAILLATRIKLCTDVRSLF